MSFNTDTKLRLEALIHASSANNPTVGTPCAEQIVARAQAYYDFLKGVRIGTAVQTPKKPAVRRVK